ncbi:C-terminal binding protein [Nocardioides sp. NPDC127514]|uniref:C-terminal binding protein n=1 Tax=unclassified Nocardioides TaxID=2615069 RepID=UPI0033214ACD
MTRTVLVTDFAWPNLEPEARILSEAGAELLVAETGDEEELVALAPRADAILTCWKRVGERVLRAADRCLTVARYGVGLDNIDLQVATSLGMVVSNVPHFCLTEVADHTMALVLADARHISGFATQTSAGVWDNRACGPMHRLGGRVFGLVGYGNIAQQVAVRAKAFGFDVVAFSPSRVGSSSTDGVRFAKDLQSLLTQSDVVSLHTPLTPDTRHLIGAAELAAMKPGALLVNTSRGLLVDQVALVDSLSSGGIRAAALDVLEEEPPRPGDPLLSAPNVITTPHAAFDSVEAIAELQETAARNVAAVLAGRLPDHVVNDEVVDSPQLRLGREIAR